MVKNVYDIIKKQNGEKFAQTIRNNDSSIFDIKNIDKIVKFAGIEAEPIMNYLTSLKNVQIEEYGICKGPIELLKEAGYIAFYADTLEKQNDTTFQSHFAKNEELCTFNDKHRFKNYYIIHCTKENINDIKRKDFRFPKRQDEYGTSAISIQIAKSGGFISIKNRYNHAAAGCDNTFNSNPDNIILGLSASLKNYFNVDFSSQQVALPDGYIIMNEQILKYNSEVNDVYFGQDFHASHGEITKIDKLREIMVDNCILNLSTQEIITPVKEASNSFAIALKEETEGKKLLVKEDKNETKYLFADGIEILKIKNGNIVSLNFPNVTKINNGFLARSEYLQSVNMIKLKTMTMYCFKDTNLLSDFNAPNLQTMGKLCFYDTSLISFDAPNLQTMGSYCFKNAKLLTYFKSDKLRIIENGCLNNVNSLISLLTPNLTIIKDNCFEMADNLTSFNTPNLQKIGNNCFIYTKSLTDLNVPKLNKLGQNCFKYIESLTAINMPEYLIPNKIKERIKKYKIIEQKNRVLSERINNINIKNEYHKINSVIIKSRQQAIK